MSKNNVTEVCISAIEVFCVGTNQDRFTYNAKDCRNPVTWLDYTKLQEGCIYRTKDDILKSL
jgi:hypothetical protein